MEIVRKKLTADEITPANIRYNPDCDCVEQTWDGGTTWTPTPGADPRTSPAYRAPANSSDAPQCNAAANMVAALRDMVDADISADNSLSLATLLLGTALLFVPVAGWIADAFLLIADAIILLDQATIEAAFTSDVYDQLLCTFFCNIDPDGQMSDAQLVQFLSDVSDNYAFTVYSVVTNHSNTLGAVGWSNMGALGTGTGSDCSDCSCAWCYQWDDNAALLAEGFTHVYDNDVSQFWSAVSTDFTIVRAEFPFCMAGGGGAASAFWNAPSFGSVWVLFTPTTPGCFDFDSNDSPPIPALTLGGFSWGVNSGGDVVPPASTNGLKLHGTGTMPAWTNGHEC